MIGYSCCGDLVAEGRIVQYDLRVQKQTAFDAHVRRGRVKQGCNRYDLDTAPKQLDKFLVSPNSNLTVYRLLQYGGST